MPMQWYARVTQSMKLCAFSMIVHWNFCNTECVLVVDVFCCCYFFDLLFFFSYALTYVNEDVCLSREALTSM